MTMTLGEWEAAIELGVVLELTNADFRKVCSWKARGEPTFTPVELCSYRRRFYATAPNMTEGDLSMLIAIRG
jgi:hypothetical protein